MSELPEDGIGLEKVWHHIVAQLWAKHLTSADKTFSTQISEGQEYLLNIGINHPCSN